MERYGPAAQLLQDHISSVDFWQGLIGHQGGLCLGHMQATEIIGDT
jgi:hypothetical protein